MTKEKEDKQTEGLSEWQKRNREYLEKKAQEEEEEQKELAEKKKQRQEQLQHWEEADAEEVSSETDSAEDADATEEDEGQSEEQQEPLTEELDQDGEELSEKERKKLAKLQKKAEENSSLPPIRRIHIYRALPVLIISSLLLLLSIYFLTPLATMKRVEIAGNQVVSDEQLLASARIDKRDYTLTTFINQANHIRNFKAASPWIEEIKMSYQFPITFKVNVKEYQVLAYLHENDSYYPILANGQVIEEATASLPEDRLTVEFSDRSLIKEFAKQLKNVPESVTKAISQVQLTPSKVTQDLVTLTMTDGNKILVPISHIAKKLPYYQGIRSQLEAPSIVDMEAGIFSYLEGAENEPKTPESTEAAENTDNTAEEANPEERPEEGLEQGQTEETSPPENTEITENN